MMTIGAAMSSAETRRSRAPLLLWLAPAVLLFSFSEIKAGDLYDQSYTPVDFADRWSGWGGIGGYYGTDQSSYGVLTLFLPLAQTPDSLFFTEIDGKYFDGDVIEGNFAVGYRNMTASGFNLGIWGGGDFRKTASDNVFVQVSGGLEALSDHFDARVNGYWASGGPQTVAAGIPEVILDGANIYMVGGQEVALSGVDGEVGLRLPFKANAGALGIYGGGFWFDSDDVPQAITGPKARVELAFNDILGAGSRITGEYEYSHDSVRGDRHQVGARLRIPLGPTPAAPDVTQQWLRMTDPLERDTDIVITGSGPEPVEDAITEVDFEQVVMTSALDDLQTVLTNAGGNSLIIADGVDGTIAGEATLSDDQTLQGGGSTIQVRGLVSGALGDFTAPGERPTVSGDGEETVLRVVDHTHLAGLDIVGIDFDDNGVGATGAGIFAAFTDLDVSGFDENGFALSNQVDSRFIFRDVSVSDVGAQGMMFANASGVQVEFTNVWVSDTNANGIDFNRADNAVVNFTNVWVSDAGFNGISFFDADNAVVDFDDVWVSETGSAGIGFRLAGGAVVDLNNVWVSNTAAEGFEFAGAGGAVVDFNNVWVSETGDAGIDFLGAGGAVVDFNNVWVSEVDDIGILFVGASNAVVDFDNVWVSDIGGTGIDFTDAGNLEINFNDVWVSDTGGDGIRLVFANNATVDFTNVRITDTGGHGIDFGDADGLIATFTDVTFSGMIGDGDDYLFRTNGVESPAVSLNGNLINDTDNFVNGTDALCQGFFEGTVLVDNGVPVTITDGVGSDGGVSCAGVPSDRRLKHDIQLVSMLDNGIRLYSFRYLWSDTAYVGVMAQDLLADERFSDAAIMTPSGYYVVDYASLGLRMTTLDAWKALGRDAVSLPVTIPALAKAS